VGGKGGGCTLRTKLVTSYYPFHTGQPYWGQLNRDRWYKYSLATISNMGEITCYTDPGDKGYNQLMELKNTYNLQNLIIKIYEIKDNPYQDRVNTIRTTKADRYNNPNAVGYYTRPTVIYWMKFIFLDMEFEPNTNMYWIDSGLSHCGLFPPHASKYGIESEFATFYQNDYWNNEYKVYHYDKAFTPEVLSKIDKFVGDKLINLCRKTSDDNPIEFNKTLNVNTIYDDIHPAGGFFGGPSELLSNFNTKCKQVMEDILSVNEVCSDQSIMAYVNATNRDWFRNWHFDTFYHEGWTNVFKPGQVSFSHFFLKPLV